MAPHFRNIPSEKLDLLSVEAHCAKSLVSVGQTFMRGDNTGYKSLSIFHKSKLYVKTKQTFSKDINSFASKVDKRKIVEVNAEWKPY